MKMLSARERFERNFRVENSGCWIWMARRLPSGYGMFSVRGRGTYAHRFSYQTFVGPIGYGKVVAHRCDNPSCVNPEHLFAVSQAENVRDMIQKGRQCSNPKKSQKTRLRGKLGRERIHEIMGSNLSLRELARKYLVSARSIKRIKDGEVRV